MTCQYCEKSEPDIVTINVDVEIENVMALLGCCSVCAAQYINAERLYFQLEAAMAAMNARMLNKFIEKTSLKSEQIDS